MTTPITKEHLRAHIKKQMKQREMHLASPATEQGFREYLEMEIAVNEIALASLEAEAVGEVVLGEFDDCGCHPDARVACIAADGQADWENFKDGTRLYTAPPAPVSVPAAMEMDDDFDSAFEHGKAVGWNAYRADFLKNCATAKDHQIRELVNELRDIAVEYHGTQQLRERIARTVRAAMLQGADGNSPAITDGWVACSERMPEVGGMYLCYVQDEYELDISHFCFEYLAAHKKFDSAGINITHWMPLPAAPQREGK